ncbi:MAG: hypothetical protein J5758_00475, partial [Abditibacteriota bacterium]|nr:hypothetical protein [Abditibacteriota bacterium]
CIQQGDWDLGVALADVGWDKTDVAVFTDGNIQMCAVLPVGIHDMVNTISWVYRISFEEASYVFENYSNLLMTDSQDKKLLGLASDPERKWLEVGEYNRFLEDLCRQLAGRVIACVEKEGYGGQIFSGYVFTGGLAKVRGLAAALSKDAPNGCKVKTGRSYGFSGMDYITGDPQWFPALGALKVMAADDADERGARDTIGKKIIGFFGRLFPK